MSDAGVFGGLVGPHLVRAVWEEDVSVDHIVRIGGLRQTQTEPPAPSVKKKSSGCRVRSERRVDLRHCYSLKLIGQRAAGLKLTGRYVMGSSVMCTNFDIFLNKTVESDQR